jgi:hypothetical protein
VSVAGVDHMSLYTNRDHLAKLSQVQHVWLKNQLGALA